MFSQKGLTIEPLFELDITATDSVLITFIMRRKERFAIPQNPKTPYVLWKCS